MRAAIYARFSTDRQSETSIADQERVCRARATALDLDVIAVDSDQAISGSTPVERRTGSMALLAEAHAGRFSALLLEASTASRVTPSISNAPSDVSSTAASA
jgi:site-specific DNA recombinase